MSFIKNLLSKNIKEPKWWDTEFACTVIDAYRSGKLSKHNVSTWEAYYAKQHNKGFLPLDGFGTKAILEYHIATGKLPPKYMK